MSLDQWMNLSGVTGICTYLTAWWWVMRGVSEDFRLFNRVLRFCGFSLILIPLFLRWYLTNGLILLLSLLMAAFFGFLLYRHRTKA